MSRAKKAKPAAKKPSPATSKPALSIRAVDVMGIADDRLKRACDLMTVLDYILRQDDWDMDLDALALATRDLLDRVRSDLLPIRKTIERAVQP